MAKDLSFLDEQAPDAVGNADLTRLRKLWLDERMSPELLAYDHDLVERVREMIRFQADSINMMLDDMRTNTENMDSAAVERRRMEIPILEMELDRVKYILTSYLRSRLKKVCASDCALNHFFLSVHLFSPY
jgi:GINS complex subunit 4